MILGADAHGVFAVERGERDRVGVVRVVLVRLPRAQHPHPRSEHRRDVDHVFTRGDELLCEQIAEPASGLDRPRPTLREPVSPRQQLACLPAFRMHQPACDDVR
jgi:hypothetical protein